MSNLASSALFHRSIPPLVGGVAIATLILFAPAGDREFQDGSANPISMPTVQPIAPPAELNKLRTFLSTIGIPNAQIEKIVLDWMDHPKKPQHICSAETCLVWKNTMTAIRNNFTAASNTVF